MPSTRQNYPGDQPVVTPLEKKALRKHYLAVRSSLTGEDRRVKDEKIRGFFESLIHQKKFSTVFLYHPFRDEPDVWALALQLKHTVVALPVMAKSGRGTMVFVRVESQTTLVPNRFGILEPEHSEQTVVQPSDNTLVVVPALAVDQSGVRLGYGGGYYDRYFGGLEAGKKPILAAAVYRESLVTQLPYEAHDLRVNYVVTEDGSFEMPVPKKGTLSLRG